MAPLAFALANATLWIEPLFLTRLSLSMLPHARPQIAPEDIAAVTESLGGPWLTSGPAVEAFEREFAARVDCAHAVALSSDAAAAHAAFFALGIGPGDEVLLPAIAFPALANAVVLLGATPVFADVEPSSLLISPTTAAARLSARTKAIVCVDYAGQCCDYESLRLLAGRQNLALVADSSHALGASSAGRKAGSMGDVSVFGFHPTMPMTTSEGGMVTTNVPEFAARMRTFRNHGVSDDDRQRAESGSWFYAVTHPGYNYRLSDMQCALGLSQLRRLAQWVERRRQLAQRYNAALAGVPGVTPLAVRPRVQHAYGLYVVRVELVNSGRDRSEIYTALYRAKIRADVHWLPLHLHPYYRQRFRTSPGLCPVAEQAYDEILSLPLFPAMTDADVDRVVNVIGETIGQR